MLITETDLPSAFDDMTGRAPAGERLNSVLPLDRYDTSFTRQAWDMVGSPEKCPDVIIGTVFSGIPPIDALRGFYDGLGKEYPVFLPLHVNQRFAKDYYATTQTGRLARTRGRYWTNRLKPMLGGAKVTVVEEYVSTGACLEVCHELIKNAGAASVTAVRGKWYSDVFRGDINIRRMTSTHDVFMRGIGRKAACVDLSLLQSAETARLQ